MRAQDVVETELVRRRAERERLTAEIRRLDVLARDARSSAERVEAMQRRRFVAEQVGLVDDEISKLEAERKSGDDTRAAALAAIAKMEPAAVKAADARWRAFEKYAAAVAECSKHDAAGRQHSGYLPWEPVLRVEQELVEQVRLARRFRSSMEQIRLDAVARSVAENEPIS